MRWWSSLRYIELRRTTDAQKQVYILAGNRIGGQGSWSGAPLRGGLNGLVEIGYEVALTGFDKLEIDAVLSFGKRQPPLCGLDLDRRAIASNRRLRPREKASKRPKTTNGAVQIMTAQNHSLDKNPLAYLALNGRRLACTRGAINPVIAA